MKKFISGGLAIIMTLALAACGSAETAESTSLSIKEEALVISEEPIKADEEETKEEADENVIPENSYRSELTNEWVSNDIKDQRPIAVMIDNEKTALPHYGTSDADIVYEMVNSTLNGRITRLMCIYKDWQNVEQIGNIRSTRPTNCYLFSEYNAILLHDGGPYFIDEWLAYENATNHLSGGFARIDRGKASFYEEYATNEHYTGKGEFAGKSYSSVLERIEDAGYDLEYNDYYKGEHFTFSDEEFSLESEKDAITASVIKPNFPHNESTLTYDKEKGVYVYSEYDDEYTDAYYDDERGLEFENVILYAAPLIEYGEGYMMYMGIGTTKFGYYCTNGYAVPIKWEKEDQASLTKFYRLSDGEEITLNTGKTYIGLCPQDTWSDLVIK